MNEKVRNIVLALVYEIICIPLLTIITKNLITTNIINASNSVLFFVLCAFIIGLNIVLVYAISYIYNNVLKFKNKYYIIVGIIGILVTGILYYATKGDTNAVCTGTAANCLETITRSRSAIIPFVASVAYFAFYLLLSRISILNFRNKKSELESNLQGE